MKMRSFFIAFQIDHERGGCYGWRCHQKREGGMEGGSTDDTSPFPSISRSPFLPLTHTRSPNVDMKINFWSRRHVKGMWMHF